MGDPRNSMIGVLRCREPEKFDHTHFHYANLAYSYYISIKKGRNGYQVKLKPRKKRRLRPEETSQDSLSEIHKSVIKYVA